MAVCSSNTVSIKTLTSLAIEAICLSVYHYGWETELAGLLPRSLVAEIQLTFKDKFFFLYGGWGVSKNGSKICIPCYDEFLHALVYKPSACIFYDLTGFEPRPLHYRSMQKTDYETFCSSNFCSHCSSSFYDNVRLFFVLDPYHERLELVQHGC